MHTYRKSHGEPLFTVGYWVGNSETGWRWEPLKDFDTEKKAAEYVNYLNGGNSTVDVFITGLKSD